MPKKDFYNYTLKALNKTMVVYGYLFCIIIGTSFFFNDIFDKLYMARWFLIIFFIASCSGDFLREVKNNKKQTHVN